MRKCLILASILDEKGRKERRGGRRQGRSKNTAKRMLLGLLGKLEYRMYNVTWWYCINVKFCECED